MNWFILAVVLVITYIGVTSSDIDWEIWVLCPLLSGGVGVLLHVLTGG